MKVINILYIVVFISVVILIIKKLMPVTTDKPENMTYKYTFNYLVNKIDESDRLVFKGVLLNGCTKLGIKPIDLMSVMFSESGLQPDIINDIGGATGIFQFMPDTAKRLGTTVQKIHRMKASEQLIYVFKYLKPYKGRLKTAFDIYLVTFWPAGLGKPNNYIFETKKISRSAVAKGNRAIDLNKDGKITMKEFKHWFKQRIYK
jgi:hypothetical protein